MLVLLVLFILLLVLVLLVLLVFFVLLFFSESAMLLEVSRIRGGDAGEEDKRGGEEGKGRD
jgi:hypothetical protein